MSLVYAGRALLCAILTVVMLVQSVQAQTPISVAALQPRENAAQERIEAALQKSVTLEFVDTPLRDVASYIAKETNITIILTKKLEDAGVQPDARVTARGRGVSLESFLIQALADLNLTLMIKDEVLKVTTVEDAQSPENMMTRVYPVQDLIGQRGEWGYDFDALIDMITSTIEPDSWQDVGGPGSIAGFDDARALVIAQRHDIHRKVEALLTTLRRVKRMQGISTPTARLSLPASGDETPPLSRSLKYSRRSSSPTTSVTEQPASPYGGGGGLFTVSSVSSFAPRKTPFATAKGEALTPHR